MRGSENFESNPIKSWNNVFPHRMDVGRIMPNKRRKLHFTHFPGREYEIAFRVRPNFANFSYFPGIINGGGGGGGGGTGGSGSFQHSIIKKFSPHPYFDFDVPRNITTRVGQTAFINCRVEQIGDKWVSDEF